MKIKKSGPDDIQKAADAGTVAVTGFASMVHPLLGVAVGMAVALFGPAIERRQGRARELIQYVHDNISEFTPEILGDEVFQDGFVLLMEKYIRERNDDKRVILQKVLRGYIEAPNLLDYPLEEMTDLVSRIRMSDVAVLRNALQEETATNSSRAGGDPKSFMLREDPNAVSRLIYFGLLHEDRTTSGPQIREYDDKNFLHVWVSPTGRAFAKYINQ
ncbi:MAG: hypothetical protein AAB971_00415 [Patescibacteria group bacterium]